MHNNCPGGKTMHTGIYVNKKSMKVSQLICSYNIAYSIVTLYRSQGSRPSPWKRNGKKGKMVV